eukprot:751344-Hanusia_phi.AAC.3
MLRWSKLVWSNIIHSTAEHHSTSSLACSQSPKYSSPGITSAGYLRGSRGFPKVVQRPGYLSKTVSNGTSRRRMRRGSVNSSL